ncbi:DegT/DnrJ/EryC1/StrS family aminotransferase [Microbacterium kribbense]|uniref:DegT/DnrJ/EryC1/StrS family aminotransferase n=1 Tax=Microbacterium kribbense TaxID=433645 RepID=UPI0031D892B9
MSQHDSFEKPQIGSDLFDVPFIRPEFPRGEDVATDMNEIVQSNWFTNFGPREREFRGEVAEYVGGDSVAVTFANATLALTVALAQLTGSHARGYVIAPSFTFAAGPQAIRWVGHEPILIDIDERTLQPSLTSAREAFERFGDQIVGILYCNTFGIGGDSVAAWESMARQFGVPLIIDSAAGFGSEYSLGDKVGTRGDCEIFSFHATKPFAIGEGGAALTRDRSLAARLSAGSNFGFMDHAGASIPGTNGKLQEINAAIGIRQLQTFDIALEARRRHLQRYHDLISRNVDGYFPRNDLLSSVCFASVVLPSASVRDAVLSELHSCGVEARAYYSPPIHLQPAFTETPRVDSLGVTESVYTRILSLPVFPSLPESAFERVEEAVQRHPA